MKNFYLTIALGGLLGFCGNTFSQSEIPAEKKDTVIVKAETKKKWYDVFSLKGYTQIRYNRLLETNSNLKCDQCDKSWGKGGSLFFRRARLVLSGNVHERVYGYIQVDMANTLSSGSASANLNFVQLRDLYFDFYLNKKKQFRLRPGLSKVPFGFDNLQSSSNRLPLDRSDPINSAVPNERDMGVFFYWTPLKIKERFKYLTSSGLKGTGDYGVFGTGIYTGQTASRPDLNDNLHLVARLAYPFLIGEKQILEPAIFAYSGFYNTTGFRSSGVKGDLEFKDERIGASIIKYPQPIGFQAEYNIGTGPAFDPADSTIKQSDLHGGHVQVMYMLKLKGQIITPYARAQYYDGGKKHEKDAARHEVKELEIGVEWRPIPAFELTAAYVMSERTFIDFTKPINTQSGNLLRLQAQFNY